MARVANNGPDDRAAANLSPNARSRAARNAGRRRFAQMDRVLERYTRLETKRTRLCGQLARAEAREARQAAEDPMSNAAVPRPATGLEPES